MKTELYPFSLTKKKTEETVIMNKTIYIYKKEINIKAGHVKCGTLVHCQMCRGKLDEILKFLHTVWLPNTDGCFNR